MNTFSLSAFPIYDKDYFDPIVEINNVFRQTKTHPLSYVDPKGFDPWKEVTPDGRFRKNEYDTEDKVFHSIGQYQKSGNRHYEGEVKNEIWIDSNLFLDMKGTGIMMRKRNFGVIAPKKFIKISKLTGRKYISKDILPKY
jgi:hypothetical protein